MTEEQKINDQVPCYQVPEAGDIPAEDATSPQVMYAPEHDQAEGDVDQDVDQEDEVRPTQRQRS